MDTSLEDIASQISPRHANPIVIIDPIHTKLMPINSPTERMFDSIDDRDIDIDFDFPTMNPEAPPFVPTAVRPSPNNPFDAYIQTIMHKVSDGNLVTVCSLDKHKRKQGLNEYIANKFYKPLPPRGRRAPPPVVPEKNNRIKQRKRYRRIQTLIKRDRKIVANMIFSGEAESKSPPEQDIRDVYQNIFESKSAVDNHNISNPKNLIRPIWFPITHQEITHELRTMPNKAAGPDGIRVPQLKNANVYQLAVIINISMSLEDQPDLWKFNNTTLIPKTTDNLHLATNWRPITVSSVILRLFHRILAERILKAVVLNANQRAFIPADGCFENVKSLDTVIKKAKREKRMLNIIGIDISKAFDSVSHHSIMRSLQRIGAEPGLINYIRANLSNVRTNIICRHVVIQDIAITRGVKQGDPLSPIIFNIFLDELMEMIPNIGFPIGEHQRISIMGFADDIILLSNDNVSMRYLLQLTTDFFIKRSMIINARKCFALRLIPAVKSRIMVTDRNPMFSINDTLITPCTTESLFKYLGIQFSPAGSVTTKTKNYQAMIDRLRIFPLKPQQKRDMLTTFLIPKLLHQLVLGPFTISLLKQLDAITKKFVKDTLRLPHDTADAILFNQVKAGGLGIPELSTMVPKIYLNRTRNMSNSTKLSNNIIVKDVSFTAQIRKAKRVLGINGEIPTANEMNTMIRNNSLRKLYGSTDGSGLAPMKTNPHGQRWVTAPTHLVTGYNYIDFIKLRCNRLPTKANMSRGRPNMDTRCRNCHTNRAETLNHITQNCPAMHLPRIKRHDDVVNYLHNRIRSKEDCQVYKEPFLNIENRNNIKPDILIITNSEVIFCDVSITGDHHNSIELAHNNKMNTYDTVAIRRFINETYPGKSFVVHPFIISSRGVFSRRNFQLLYKLSLRCDPL